MELCQADAGRTYSREKCNRNSLGRRATARSDDQRGGQRKEEIDYAPGSLPCTEKMQKSAGERRVGCNGQDEVGGGGGALGQSRFSSGFSQPSK